MAASTTEVNSYTGATQNYGSGVPFNTGGSFDLDTDYKDPAPAMTTLIYDDNQGWPVNSSTSYTMFNVGTSQYSYIGWTQNDYHLILQRYADHKQAAQFNWGFQWDNYNDTWPSPPGAPIGYGYTSYGGTVGGTSPAGEFYGQYGIIGL